MSFSYDVIAMTFHFFADLGRKGNSSIMNSVISYY